MLILVLGLILFLGIHSLRIFGEDWRGSMIARLGNGTYRGLHSVASLVGLVLIVWGFGRIQGLTPVLYEPPVGLRHLTVALMLPALILVVAGSVPPGHIRRWLGRPMLLGVMLWALGHLLANGDLASLLLFGAFLAWAVADWLATESQVPPAPPAIVWDGVAVVVGLGLYLLLLWWLHEWLIGLPPVA